jgi:hypothetical protein
MRNGNMNRGGSEQRSLIQTRQTHSNQQLNSDRPRSLNPQIYPSWWGDDSLVVNQNGGDFKA